MRLPWSVWAAVCLLCAHQCVLFLLHLAYKADAGPGRREGFAPAADGGWPAAALGAPESAGDAAPFPPDVRADPHTIYDPDYCARYDLLHHFPQRLQAEVQALITAVPRQDARIVDLGSGTGHFVGALRAHGYRQVRGVDRSPSMVRMARQTYPAASFSVGDFAQPHFLPPGRADALTLLYFSAYETPLPALLSTCWRALARGGVLLLHAVDKATFDPILPPGNPLTVSPQRYARQRITRTKVQFEDCAYTAVFQDLPGDRAQFIESFRFPDGRTRRHEHTLHLVDRARVIDWARARGFHLDRQVDLVQAMCEHQYLLVLRKPA